MFRTTISLYHDTRKVLKTLKHGQFPIKVRFTTKVGDKWVQYYYNTGKSVTQEDWEKIKSGKVRRALRVIMNHVNARRQDAQNILDDKPHILPAEFDARFTGRQSNSAVVKTLFDEMITAAEAEGRISSAGSYKDARNALTGFGGESLTLNEIDKDFLQRFEREMRKPYKVRYKKKDPTKKETVVEKAGRTSATIGIYMRNLATAFNIAIERRILSPDLYPFGVKRYVIPESANVKIALTAEDKSKLLAFRPTRPAAVRALAAWTFSYYCNGMNFSDIAHLTKENIRGDVLHFVRNKSKRKKEPKPIVMILHRVALEILRAQRGKPYLFGVIDEKDPPKRRKARIHQWIKTTNEQMGKICQQLGIERVTTYTARHTSATMMLRAGANVVDIRDALGHAKLSTTEKYLASLDLEEKRKMSELL